MSVAVVSTRLSPATRRRVLRRNSWTIAVYAIFVLEMIAYRVVKPDLGSFDILNLVSGTLPLALATMAQASVVLGGGIDLSIGTMMALVNVIAVTRMEHTDFGGAILISVLVIAGTAAAGAATGAIVTWTRVPDIIVTLATSYIWWGLALWIMPTPGGTIPTAYQNLVNGEVWTVVPEGLFVLLGVLLVIWLPFYRSRLGLALYALGSNRTAAYLSGISVGRTRIMAYTLGGVLAGLAGLALTAYTTSGDPNQGTPFTLESVAAVVLGGVALTGGKGGMLGPIAGAFVLGLVSTLLGVENVDPNWSYAIQGAILVLIVIMAGLLILRRRA
jgi:ribose transport system permease protein